MEGSTDETKAFAVSWDHVRLFKGWTVRGIIDANTELTDIATHSFCTQPVIEIKRVLISTAQVIIEMRALWLVEVYDISYLYNYIAFSTEAYSGLCIKESGIVG